ncbi:MAG: hypothetical protein ACI93P_001413 [bacterium]|jgi:hypothetical protein
MKRKIGIYLYQQGTIINIVFNWLTFVIHAIKFNPWTDKRFTQRAYKTAFGRTLDLESPQGFNEKIQWLKLNDRNSTKTLCADKYTVRSYVKSKVGEKYLIPLLLCTRNPLDIGPNNLPEFPIIAKTNHASGQVFIIKDKSYVDFIPIQDSFRYQLRKNFYHAHREWQYKNIIPRILVEKLLLDEEGHIPKDYKVHCFHGVPHYIQVDSERFSEHTRCIYDTEWNLQEIEYNKPRGDVSPRPTKLNEILNLAQVLSNDFIYVRADFYQVGEHVYFGELTFTPEAGRGAFSPLNTDLAWGKLIHLP